MHRVAVCLMVLALCAGCANDPAPMSARDLHQQLIGCYRQPAFFRPGQKDAPAALAAPLAAGLVVLTCADEGGNTHDFVRVQRPSAPGICRLRENEIFPAASHSRAFLDMPFPPPDLTPLSGWSDQPPEAWKAVHYTPQSRELGLVSTPSCPSGNDARYMILENVTDGMLLQFQRAWDRATASPEAFDKVFGDVPSFRPSPEEPSGYEKLDLDRGLTGALRDDIFDGHVRVGALRCGLKDCYAATQRADMEIHFDMGPEGLVFTRLVATVEALVATR